MKKSLLIVGFAIALASCNKTESTASEFKTAYVDTQKLVENSDELKDLESKAKVKENELGMKLQEKAKQWQMDAASFESEARVKGEKWAQMRAQDLKKREQEISQMQQAMQQEFAGEFGVKRDTIVSQIKKYIKDYGKKNGYDYIYGTGDAASVLYAKEGYDITDEVLKNLNEKFSGGTATETADAKEEKDSVTDEKK